MTKEMLMGFLGRVEVTVKIPEETLQYLRDNEGSKNHYYLRIRKRFDQLVAEAEALDNDVFWDRTVPSGEEMKE